MEILNINKYIKTIENKNLIMVYHNNILNIIIDKNRRLVYTTAPGMKKYSIKQYINTIPDALHVEILENIDNIINIKELEK